MNKVTKVPILSFYSGGGFLDMGFEQAGFETVWTNEVDTIFAQLHSAGMTSWRKSLGNNTKAEIFNTKSIIEISSAEIIKEAFSNEKPKVFGIIGGPPCQDFSIRGSRKGFEGDRGKLTILFFDKILELKPTFFVMENVTGLVSKKETNEFLQKLLKRVKDFYYVDHEILNALEFNVPQSRERVFFIGLLKKAVKKEDITNYKRKWFTWPSKILIDYSWPEAVKFGGQPIKSDSIPLNLCVESCLVPLDKMKTFANANEYFKLHIDKKKLAIIKEGETNRPSFKRLHRFKYSPTACYGNNEVHLHPYQHRRLSVRETLRIQGVPDEYILPTELPLTKKFKMIGNGVPVPLAKKVAEALQLFLKSKKII